jgi:hypothetical protein
MKLERVPKNAVALKRVIETSKDKGVLRCKSGLRHVVEVGVTLILKLKS